MFSTETKINGEHAKGVIKLVKKDHYGTSEKYLAVLEFDEIEHKKLDAYDIRTLAKELNDIADKIDELNE